MPGRAWATEDPRPPTSDVADEPPLTIPPKHKTSANYLLGLPAVKALIGDYPHNLFFLLESHSPLPGGLSLDTFPLSALPSTGVFCFNRDEADVLVRLFFETAHPAHPILDREVFDAIYTEFTETGLDSTIESALCMVVIALGAVAASLSDRENFRMAPPGMQYMEQALPTLIILSSWSFSPSIFLPQALVLASVYFAYIVRPLQSWRLVYSAATILQFKLSGLVARLGTVMARS